MSRSLIIAISLALAGSAYAQEGGPAAAPAAPAVRTVTAPAGTVVEIELTKAISTRTSKIGEAFPIRLNRALTVDGVVVLPAGLEGQGEILHLAKPGLGGRGGEIILSAKFLQKGDQRIALRSFQMGAVGIDNTATGVTVMALAGVAGFLVTGGHIEIPSGSVANAKLVADLSVTAPLATPAP